jgi:hypothetical protein
MLNTKFSIFMPDYPPSALKRRVLKFLSEAPSLCPVHLESKKGSDPAGYHYPVS